MSRNRNPYSGVDWNNRIEVVSCTHMHCRTQEHLDKYVSEGINLMAISNYYPSAPYYPMAAIREDEFACGQQGGVFNGKYTPEYIDFNQELAKWQDELSPECRARLPFKPGKPVFEKIPENLLEIPNAEYHSFSDDTIYLHITAPGATVKLGNFDVRNEFKLAEHGFKKGTALPWREGFDLILDSLLTSDGGGIIINHPTWSHMPPERLMEYLDYDPRVLGIEVFNYGSRTDFTDFSDTLWDDILRTGRQCFGFFVQDHPKMDRPWLGKILILPEERTPESCLAAIRQGRFYGMIRDTGLRFEYLNFDGKCLRARCNREVEFQRITAQGVFDDVIHAQEICWEIPECDRKKHVFMRLTAREGREYEKLFSQAFML